MQYFASDNSIHDMLSEPAFVFSFWIAIALVIVYFAVHAFLLREMPSPALIPLSFAEADHTHGTTSPDTSIHYAFSHDGTLQEAGSPNESSSPYFWLNSGGMLQIHDGIGETIQGSTLPFSTWRMRYASNNPLDTDGGKYPQNLFRLVSKGVWNNVTESLQFKLSAVNTTNTPNRDGYSGVLLMSRYQDEMNLYYAGLRMDGTAVIKKKYRGTYYTLAEKQVFAAAQEYNRYANPNLIPQGIWMGLRSETKTQGDGSVAISLWIDKANSGAWDELLTATDTPGANGTDTIAGPAHVGIRTDYLDVQFDNYDIDETPNL